MTTNPREIGIAFTLEMLEAVRADRKTQTRRPATAGKMMVVDWDRAVVRGAGGLNEYLHVPGYHHDDYGPEDERMVTVCCRYLVGDRLYFKERIYAHPIPSDSETPSLCAYYKSDWKIVRRISGTALLWRWRSYGLPARYMPKEAARDWAVVTRIRAQRVGDISYEDICAEGWDARVSTPVTDGSAGDDARAWFIELWDSINAKRGYSWESNPWVFAITFERIER